MRRRFGVLAVLLTLLGAGCGKELLAGGFGDVDAVATDGGAQADRAPALAAGRPAAPATQLVGVQGTLGMTAAMALVRDDGTVAPLTGAVPVQLRLAAAEEVTMGGAPVPTGRYTTARLTFTRVEADVTAGTGLGGIQLGSRVTVAIGATPLVVDRPIDLRVERDGRHRVVMDANSAAWLAAAAPGGAVPAAAFAAAVRVSAR